MADGYGDLYYDFGWNQGVHKAPVGYEHPWLVVTPHGTFGAWSRARARLGWRQYRDTNDAEYAYETAERGY